MLQVVPKPTKMDPTFGKILSILDTSGSKDFNRDIRKLFCYGSFSLDFNLNQWTPLSVKVFSNKVKIVSKLATIIKMGLTFFKV